MKLILTGGGTGGHIYPALTIGVVAAEQGAELLYFGSIRGQESGVCRDRGIPFTGFPSEPLYSLKSLRGLRALVKLQQARVQARRALRQAKPDAVFSTGGYSAGPVVAAARDLRIPYVIHSSDSVPARSSSLFAKDARAFTCAFRSTVGVMADFKVVRTGQPIRRELRAAADNTIDEGDTVLVIGGSQGSEYLNSTVPKAALECPKHVKFIHVSGPNNHATTTARVEQLGLAARYRVVPYLHTEELLGAYRKTTIAVARSGGTLAEVALFGLPSVLVPLPSAANNHQLHNAEEFVRMDAATLHLQSTGSTAGMAADITAWLSDPDRRQKAKRNLVDWDVPDAAEQIFALIREAAT